MKATSLCPLSACAHFPIDRWTRRGRAKDADQATLRDNLETYERELKGVFDAVVPGKLKGVCVCVCACVCVCRRAAPSRDPALSKKDVVRDAIRGGLRPDVAFPPFFPSKFSFSRPKQGCW